MSKPSNADANLLFGVLAFQNGFISRDQLVAGMQAWVENKQLPLDEHLARSGALNAELRQLLQPLVAAHLRQHGDDAERSLASLSSIHSARGDLEQLGDPDLQASLRHVSARWRADQRSTETLPPTSIGAPSEVGARFRVLRAHAEGGLGKVSLARDEELNREVALKEIKSQYADDPDSRARFTREAEITGGLEHPGIVPVYGLGAYPDGRPFYAMRFIRGQSLQDAIKAFHAEVVSGQESVDSERQKSKNDHTSLKRQRRAGSATDKNLELRQLLQRFINVCQSIEYAHSRGVLHRDLKPGNIMLGKYGETLVVDWGLAKAQGSASHDSASPSEELPLKPSVSDPADPTQMGSTVGTLQYMSPEQAAGRLDLLGPATDVFALGATLYHLLTGQTPFQQVPRDQLLDDVKNARFKPPRQVKRSIPKALEAICLKAMSRNIGDRYASAVELANAIERHLANDNSVLLGMFNKVLLIVNSLGIAGFVLFGVWIRPEFDKMFTEIKHDYRTLDQLVLRTSSVTYVVIGACMVLGLFLAERWLKRLSLRLILYACILSYECFVLGIIFVALIDPLDVLIRSLAK